MNANELKRRKAEERGPFYRGVSEICDSKGIGKMFQYQIVSQSSPFMALPSKTPLATWTMLFMDRLAQDRHI